MPVTLSVSEVRQALSVAAGVQSSSGAGSPSTQLLGRWFHEGLEQLLGDPLSESPLRRLTELEPDLQIWKQSLKQTAYEQVVGPRLTQNQAALHDVGSQVQSFWTAMQSACEWLAELSWELRPPRASRRADQPAPWESLSDLISTEEPVRWLFREPGWKDAVQLVGIADAVVRLKATGAWCVLEFKLGQTAPAIDRGQACLYHLLLSASMPACGVSGAESLAVVSFTPQRHEQLFPAEQLTPVRPLLIDLIGELAGVTGQRAASHQPAASDSAPAPRETLPTAEHLQVGARLVQTLQEYGVSVELGEEIVAGPTFLRFPIELGRGTKVASVRKFAPELQVRLQLRAEPFINLEEGRLVIDVQRPDRRCVAFDEIRGQLQPADHPAGQSQLPVGIDLSGRLHLADLSRPEHAHVLVVGTTGSGKSEWLRFAAAGLMATNTPQTLQLLIIDPKRNAFHALRNSPFLRQPLVFPDEHDVAAVLGELAEEMDRRYRLFDGADSFIDVVERTGIALPRIVCICDEYRDLISRDRATRKKIEQQICRLGAKARAAGIHLIIATQEASRETIRGPLDSNMPARVGLKVGKSLESRLLLGENGAERLLGNGDLLFKDLSDPRRLQAPLLSEENRRELFG